MSKKKMYAVNKQPKKNPLFVGTIDGTKLLLNREGKVNLGLNPELRGGVHKSKKDYDRKREKAKLRNIPHDGHS